MQDERRLHPRAVVRLVAEAQWAGSSDWQEVLLLDLSAGGAAILTRIPVEVQSQIRLRFRLPAAGAADAVDVGVTCLVMRSDRATGHGWPFLAGLHFLDLIGHGFERVRTYVWNLVHAEED